MGVVSGCGLLQGLKLGDKIAGFGSVTAANFTGLRNVADVVRHSAGVSLTFLSIIIRNVLLVLECSSCGANS